MFKKLLQSHNRPKEREEKQKEEQALKDTHQELKNETVGLIEQLKEAVRRGPPLERQVVRIKDGWWRGSNDRGNKK